MSGRRVTISDADLLALVANFKPDEDDEPQINIDHDRRGPSYGGIRAIRFERGQLLADIHNVPKDFGEQMMAGGAYPYRSAEVDLQAKKILGLALLGAKRPAVKGLGQIQPTQVVSFAEAEGDAFVDFTLDEQEGDTMPDEGNTRLAEEAGEAKAKLEFAENENAELKEQITELSEREKEREAKFAEMRDENERLKLAEAERTAELRFAEAREDASQFIDGLGAKVTPAMREAGLDKILAAIKLSGLKVELADGEVAVSDALRAVFGSAPDIVPPEGEQETALAEGEGEVELTDAELKIAAKLYQPGTPQYEDHLKRLKAAKQGEGK